METSRSVFHGSAARRWASRLAAVFAAGLGAATFPAARAAEGSGEGAACVEAWGESIYRNYGYDHIVHVKNRCEKAVLCAVSTNVNPEPTSVTVGAKGERQVLTFRGSPAKDFVPKVDCRLSLSQ